MSKSLSFASAIFSIFFLTHGFAESQNSLPQEIPVVEVSQEKPLMTVTPPAQNGGPFVKASFSSFTGKIKKDKVRIRLQPDLEGHIVRELKKNDYITVVGEEGDFYSVEPPSAVKAYVFRSFVLDGVVEGNRINVRLEPDLEAPILGHLNAGDHVVGTVSAQNNKWLEITPPSNAKFYVAKNLIDKAGDVNFKEKIEGRKITADQLFETINAFSKAEMDKSFEEIDFERVKQGFIAIIHDYTDFPQTAEKAKECLNTVQEKYLQKRIAYLEKKAETSSGTSFSIAGAISTPLTIQSWSQIEQGLFATWNASHPNKNVEEFYDDERLSSATISGILEPLTSTIRNRPGDFVIKDKNLPVAYVYSTKVNLQEHVGKQVTLTGTPRPNNSFAFPAYFVHQVN